MLASAAEARIDTHEYQDVAGAEVALQAGDVEAFLVDGTEYVTNEPILRVFAFAGNSGLSSLVAGAAQTLALQEMADAAGVSVEEIAGLLTENPLELRSLEPFDPNRETNTIVSFVGLILLYVGILSYGAWTLNGVIEEKTNRVVEVLMSALRPHQLMAGKVIGIGLLGIAQLLLIVVTAGVAALAVDLVDIPDVSIGLIGSLLMWFVLGFSFYSVAYAAAGALVSRMEEAQSVATPLDVGRGGRVLRGLRSDREPRWCGGQDHHFLAADRTFRCTDSSSAERHRRLGNDPVDRAHAGGELRVDPPGRPGLLRGDSLPRGPGEIAGSLAFSRALGETCVRSATRLGRLGEEAAAAGRQRGEDRIRS